jgi:hypothetical protein
MGSSSVTVTNVSFLGTSGDPANALNVTLKNTGTKAVTVAVVRVNNQAANFTMASPTLDVGEIKALTVTTSVWINGNPYKLDLYDGNNQVIGSTQVNAPGA